MIKRQEQEALDRIKESLEEYEDSRYVQHVLTEDLQLLVKLIEKNAKK